MRPRPRSSLEGQEETLRAILAEVAAREPGPLDNRSLQAILRRHPRAEGGFYSKAEVIRGFRRLRAAGERLLDEAELLEKIRRKPVRTQSGVAPVTVLTRPHPCPGRCIFCPSDVRMPKSYLSDEPGAQRAAEHQFDPWGQTMSRLRSLHHIGHRVDKAELIVLGGTWSFYPEAYQRWFVKRCFDALNVFEPDGPEPTYVEPRVDFRGVRERVDGRTRERTYNEVVSAVLGARRDRFGSLPLQSDVGAEESASWSELRTAQHANESALARCVGLSLETRPDHLDESEVVRLRRLGATKVQIGYQSLDDEVLRMNRRGHDVAATRRAMHLLRQAGFKVHAHWMPNLYGSDPERDVADFERLFSDPDFRPDELKVYPCSLIESAELMTYWQEKRWRPYNHEQLLEVLVACLARTPEYCRLTRVVRDIPGTDIVVGNRLTNFRQIAEAELRRRRGRCRDIRNRELRDLPVPLAELRVRPIEYRTSVGTEVFLQMVTSGDRLAGFLRLSLPDRPVFLEEVARSAMIREVHVYGGVVAIGDRASGKAQHLGLGRRLIEHAAAHARQRGFRDLAVISAIGTRPYYRRLGFDDGDLYQHRVLLP